MSSILLQVKVPTLEPRIHKLVQQTTDFLLETCFSSGNLPSSLESSHSDRLVHWCHGAPGFVHLLAHAHRVCLVASDALKYVGLHPSNALMWVYCDQEMHIGIRNRFKPLFCPHKEMPHITVFSYIYRLKLMTTSTFSNVVTTPHTHVHTHIYTHTHTHTHTHLLTHTHTHTLVTEFW